RNTWVATGIGLKADTASVLWYTDRKDKNDDILRNRRRARPRRFFVHNDPRVTVHLWIGTGRTENRLQVIAARPKIGKLRRDR
ncbi:MAG: hypothetical protein OXN92_09085, partial [Gammaproteobacteria bacterium]|nr:hypothetical protein [Gammaproteobacteria bacterium]